LLTSTFSNAAAWQRLVPRGRRDLRLASGLVLFTYLTLHLACHALGLVSLAAAERALRVTVLMWHSVPGTVLLCAAAAVHVSLALVAVYDRRTLRMPPLQALRIALGLAMPFSLIGHFIVTRYAFERYGLAGEYARVVPHLWSQGTSGLALGLLAPGWIHGCLGLRYAFGHRITSARVQLGAFAAALLLPVLAGVGFVSMGRELESRPEPYQATGGAPDPRRNASLADTREHAVLVYGGFIFLIVVGRTWRRVVERRRKSVVWITYPGRTVSVPRGWTVLEASRSFGIPHQAVCGGRARCTTCRVRVVEGASHCPAPHGDEQRVLDRIAASSESIRLACQLRPAGDIQVEPVLSGTLAHGEVAPLPLRPTEIEAMLLLVDVRIAGASGASPPSAHDTIYALGRCLHIVEAAAADVRAKVHRHSPTRWIVVLASGADRAAARDRALAAARRIERDAARLRASLAADLGVQIHAALALHAGRVVRGAIGVGAPVLVGEAVDDLERVRSGALADAPFVVSSSAAAGGWADVELAWNAPGEDGDAPVVAWAAVPLELGPPA